MRRVIAILATVVTAGCAASGARPQPFPSGRPAPGGPVEAPGAPVAASPAAGYSIAGTALGLRGVPYRNGGVDAAGFDCSGFVKYVFEQHGLSMPRSVSEQFLLGAFVDVNAVQPGDLLFFATTAPGASHVGIAIGGDQFVHAPSSNGVVRVERMGSSYWTQRFVGARRITN